MPRRKNSDQPQATFGTAAQNARTAPPTTPSWGQGQPAGSPFSSHLERQWEAAWRRRRGIG
jgi:hypothetical protein